MRSGFWGQVAVANAEVGLRGLGGSRKVIERHDRTVPLRILVVDGPLFDAFLREEPADVMTTNGGNRLHEVALRVVPGGLCHLRGRDPFFDHEKHLAVDADIRTPVMPSHVAQIERDDARELAGSRVRRFRAVECHHSPPARITAEPLSSTQAVCPRLSTANCEERREDAASMSKRGAYDVNHAASFRAPAALSI